MSMQVVPCVSAMNTRLPRQVPPLFLRFGTSCFTVACIVAKCSCCGGPKTSCCFFKCVPTVCSTQVGSPGLPRECGFLETFFVGRGSLSHFSERSKFFGVVSVWRPLAQVWRQAWRWRRLVSWAEARCCETEEHLVDVLQLGTCFG